MKLEHKIINIYLKINHTINTMIIASIPIKQYSWEPFYIYPGFIFPETNITIGYYTHYYVQVFDTQQDVDTYDPTNKNTMLGNLIYSGSIYWTSESLGEFDGPTQNTDIVEPIRELLTPNPLFDRNITCWNQQTFTSSKLYYVYISSTNFLQPGTMESVFVEFDLIPNNEYKNKYNNEPGLLLSDPILDIISPNQLLPISTYVNDKTYVNDVSLETSDDETYWEFVNLRDMMPEVTEDDQISTIFVRPSEALETMGQDMQKYFRYYMYFDDQPSIDSKIFQTDPCIKFCLYYMNLKGGWDFMPVRGKITKTDKFKNQTYSKNLYYGGNSVINISDNQPQSQSYTIPNKYLHNTIIYESNIQEDLKINLGVFTDEQVDKLPNLFASHYVYLHDLVNNEITPVMITSTQFDHKHYTDNRTMSKITITVTKNYNRNIYV